MNPLKWKRERRVALAAAICIGFLVGTIFGYFVEPHLDGSFWPIYWPLIFMWTAIGGFIGGAVFYIRQLLRT